VWFFLFFVFLLLIVVFCFPVMVLDGFGGLYSDGGCLEALGGGVVGE
jgi:hypothetical protein